MLDFHLIFLQLYYDKWTSICKQLATAYLSGLADLFDFADMSDFTQRLDFLTFLESEKTCLSGQTSLI